MSSLADHLVLSSTDRLPQAYFIDPFDSTPEYTSPSNCILQLQNPIQNFERLELINFSMPYTYYSREFTYITINENFIRIIFIGISTLYDVIDRINTIINSRVPGYNIELRYNPTLSRFTFNSTIPITIDGTSLTDTTFFGLEPKIYGPSTEIVAERAPDTKISPLPIFLLIDPLPLTTSSSYKPFGNLEELGGEFNPTLRSATFEIPNTTNKFGFIQFFENTQYAHRIYSSSPIVNTIGIRVVDRDNFPLLFCSDWVMVIRIVRKLGTSSPLSNLVNNELPEHNHFGTPNLIDE